MQARSLIAKLRAGTPIDRDETYDFARALGGPDVTDAQLGAFAMGTCLRGLGMEARVALTEGMRDSGDVLQWNMPAPVIDKHSTGGVGDCVSLLLAPALAECGAFVPMISGRGLGHTGGTLDKLEAIPGYTCDVSEARLRQVVGEVGCAIVGASRRVAPSDKRLYAIRDVTGTVDSIDLITASILSKKLAAGLDGLVLDVKTGSGAFMADPQDAHALATSLVEVANGAGCKTSAIITDMSQPLAPTAGNAVEIRTIMECLTGQAIHTRLMEVTLALGARALVDAGLQTTERDARAQLSGTFQSGAAAERFAKMVAALGGPRDFTRQWANVLPEAPVLREVQTQQAGYVAEIDTRRLGEAVVLLGGGRLRDGDRVDPAVGLSDLLAVGAKADRPLAMVHAASEEAAEQAVADVLSAYRFTQTPPDVPPLIRSRIDGKSAA